MKKVAALLIIFSTPAWSQEPTVIFGASQTSPGVYDETIITQPQNAPNPLGNPIVAPQAIDNSNSEASTAENNSSTMQPNNISPRQDTGTQPQNIINQSAPQNPAPFSISPSQQQNQIENTLYQGGDRIYDIQSYPLKDIKTITEPNVDPTITTYPEY